METVSNPITEQVALASLSINGLIHRLAHMLLKRHGFEARGPKGKVATQSGYAKSEILKFIAKYVGACSRGKKAILADGIDKAICEHRKKHQERQRWKNENDPLVIKVIRLGDARTSNRSKPQVYKRYFRDFVMKDNSGGDILSSCGVGIRVQPPRYYDSEKSYTFSTYWRDWPLVSWKLKSSDEQSVLKEAKAMFPKMVKMLAKRIDLWEKLHDEIQTGDLPVNFNVDGL